MANDVFECLPKLTDRQAVLLRYLHSYHAEHRYTPLQREISEHMGLSASSSPGPYLDALEKKGYLLRGGGPRNIRLTTQGQKKLRLMDDSELEPPPDPQPATRKVVVRDNFSMPEEDYRLIESVRDGLLRRYAVALNKSEVVRAALKVLHGMEPDQVLAAANAVERLKPGRKVG